MFLAAISSFGWATRVGARLVCGRAIPPSSYEDALVSLKTANALYPTSFYGRPSISCLINEGDCHATLGNIEDAKKCYVRACAVAPRAHNDEELVKQAHLALAAL